MADKGAADKTEKPTPKKLQEGRKQGQVPRSPDLAAWVTVLAFTYLLPSVITGIHDEFAAWMQSLPSVTKDPDITKVLTNTTAFCAAAGVTMLPLLGVVVLGALLAGLAQGGARPYFSRVKPKFSKVNPMAGLKKLVSPQSVWELAKNLIKLSVVGFVAWQLMKSMTPVLIGSGSLPLVTVASTVSSDAISLVRTVAMVALVVGAADYMVARRRIAKSMMMSLKEVKDEHKQSDGDPMMKGQIRRRAMAIARNRMMADIPDADVVLVNPTHVAVALKYTPGRGAPRVLAKGKGQVAARIREVATENRVPLVEDVPLARALYKSCEIGAEIPAEMFTAVAKVLAFVMALKARGAAAGFHSGRQLALSQR